MNCLENIAIVGILVGKGFVCCCLLGYHRVLGLCWSLGWWRFLGVKKEA